jgi:group I intron endonuclease
MSACIYRITNTVNGKCYVGQTIQSLEKRWNNHCYAALRGHAQQRLSRAIRKYGRDAFTVEILEDCSHTTHEHIDAREIHWIAEYNSTNPRFGYNMTEGGEGGVPTDEVRAKMSASLRGVKNPNYGKPRSVETRKRISAATLGKVFTPETRVKLSEKKRGHRHPGYGKPRSPETRAKIRETLKLRHTQKILNNN